MRKGTKVNSLLALSIAIILLLGVSSAQAADKKVEWSYVSMMMNTHPVIANSVIPLFEKYKKDSGGKFEITVYNPDTFIPTPELHQGIQRGIAEIGSIFPSRYPNEFPITTLGDAPFLFSDARAGGFSMCALLKNNKQLQKEYTKLKVLSFSTSTPFDIVSIKPIHVLKDLKGLRIGVLDASSVNIIQLLGGVPILLNLGDMYISLQRGMVGAVMAPLPTYRSTKICEVAKYITKCNIKVIMAPLVYNPDSYNALPADAKAAFNAVSTEAIASLMANWIDLSAKNDLDWLTKNSGVKVYAVPPDELEHWRDAIKPAYDEWIKLAKGNGVQNPEALIAELRGYAEKYNKPENQIVETANYKKALGDLYLNFEEK